MSECTYLWKCNLKFKSENPMSECTVNEQICFTNKLILNQITNESIILTLVRNQPNLLIN